MARKSKRSSRSSGSSSIIQNLLSGKHAGDTNHVYSQLKMRYGNDAELMNKLYSGYRERLDEIRDVATKFKIALFNHYNLDTMSFDDLLRKAKKYQKVYNISSDEFKLFLDLAMNDKRYAKQMEHMLPNSVMAATLGISSFTNFADELNVGKSGMPFVQKILELHAATAEKHREVVIQSLTNDTFCDIEKMRTHYKSNVEDFGKFNKYQHVHPVLAAMFWDKIEAFDKRMLLANMGNIIKCKVEGRPIKTQPEYDLHWAMVSDPNDINCNISNPMEDIYKRFTLQTEIWNAVSNLRTNRIVYAEAGNFINALNDCRSNIYDVPELSNILDEGTIMRKIMGAFSMRPFVTKISPFQTDESGILGALATYTTVPMINVRLTDRPSNILNQLIEKANIGTTGTSSNNKFGKATEQQINWFIENGRVTPKVQSVVHIANDVAVFNVIRKTYKFELSKFTQAPGNMQTLPSHILDSNNTPSIESVDNDIDFSNPITLKHNGENKDYKLHSVVGIQTRKVDSKDVVIGSFACIEGNKWYVPLAENKREYYDDGTYKSGEDMFDRNSLDIKTHGTLFIFTKVPEPTSA